MNLRFLDPAEEEMEEFGRFPLREFPFSLIYALEGDDHVVVAVAHHRRRPSYWMGRYDRQPVIGANTAKRRGSILALGHVEGDRSFDEEVQGYSCLIM